MEGLNNMLRIATQNRWIRGFEVSSRAGVSMEICKLLYADDTVIFCEAKEDQIRYIRVILVILEAVSSLRVNWSKISLFLIKEVAQMQRLANILRCKIEQFPTTYLGMPLRSNHKELLIWDGIIQRLEKKLAIWKSQYLSLGGRQTLINAVLDSLPTYVMSLFPLPAKVLEKLDKLRRDFLWFGNKERKGYYLVNWETMQLPKLSSGLGVRNLRIHNECLLTKWLWRYVQEEHALWREVIHHKYGQDSQWCTNEVTIPYGVSTWKTIRSFGTKLAGNIKLRIGN
ncbi:uncharacterized protein LOC125816557 [Solanum verrucosum]|uniref:uncharacterized protein LOC125816557 n=1 Tax=Solanum verrucosum TaxID=315347 RepID=UPI0020D1B1B0|nr:uncharacterized protein LOC125816557 [Solanum verrucosum]